MSESPASVIFNPNTLRRSHYAPELVNLISQGILNDDLSVADGYIEYANGPVQQYLRAFTLDDLRHAYHTFPEAAAHSIDIPASIVLDSACMDRLRVEYANNQHKSLVFETFYKEWQTVVQALLSDDQN